MPVPSGTVTFLFTDVEGSTQLWEREPEAMREALALHDSLGASVIREHAGVLVKSRGEGDSLFAAFTHAPDAMAAACALQRALLEQPWPTQTPLRVRMSLHTGPADLREGDYYGPVVNRCARLREVGHGGQVLVSRSTAEAAEGLLPEQAGLLDLGEHRLRDLTLPERVYQLLHPALPSEFAPLHSLSAVPNNLPRQLTSFVGREREIGEVKRLLGTTCLLTLTGTGGSGKTRLALHVAASLLPDYPDGAAFVELASVTDGARILVAIASALGVHEEPGRELVDIITEYLRARRFLLILDNCEHLLDPCARIVSRLLGACPHISILATSREGLGMSGETAFRVPPLSLPSLSEPLSPRALGESEAARLFTERACAASPSFSITAHSAPAIARVCQQLDGLPLAIELAAARVRTMPVEKLADRLFDRFRTLSVGNRAALPRHQTLRALIDWSYDLLGESERIILRRLSVFAGFWTLEATEAVCSGDGLAETEVLDLLTRLVDRSLVIYDEQDEQAHYRLLETVRQYALERLREAGEEDALRERHRAYYARLAEEAEPQLRGRDQEQWLNRLEAEHDNLRSALTWSVDGIDRLTLAGALWRFWNTRGHLAEGRAWLSGALGRDAGAPPAVRARALSGLGILSYRQGEFEEARRLLEESLALRRSIGDRAGEGDTLSNLGAVLRDHGVYDAAREYLEQSLRIRRGIGDQRGIAASLNNLGMIARDMGDYDNARACYEESADLLRRVGDRLSMATTLGNLGALANARGDLDTAIRLYEEGLRHLRQLDNRGGIAVMLYNLGDAVRAESGGAAALPYFTESLAMRRDLGDRVGIPLVLGALAELALEEGEGRRAARLYAAAQALREQSGAPLPPSDREGEAGDIRRVREALGGEAFERAWQEGLTMNGDEAIDYALETAPKAGGDVKK